MHRNTRIQKVQQAMLAMQRRAWEQGVAAQALLELGETDLVILFAKDALVNVPQARIEIRSRRRGNQLEVVVEDNGQGIPPENVPHLFEPFFTTKPAGEGTGLGLYICKQIVDQSQGTLDVETVVGKGTCFRVRLPVREQQG